MLPCGPGDGQVVEKDGERGRNRTFNLLFLHQPLKTNGFNDFPIVHVGRNGQLRLSCYEICYEVLPVR
jgi:hypothetical protein